jgi:L-fucose isomerase-like protein
LTLTPVRGPSGAQHPRAVRRARRGPVASRPMTMGVLVGTRGFFPGHLAESGRLTMLGAVEMAGMRTVALSPVDTQYGAVETRDDARACAALFAAHRGEIDGIIVTLPNFGDEKGVAETLRMANLGVPVLVQATGDDPRRMTQQDRRDAFCGKMSVCNNLSQMGIPFSLTTRHTVAPESAAFRADLEWFAGVCRVANGLRTARVGAIGARPAAFNTVRYSEKLLEASGISVETVDLSEILGWVGRLRDSDFIVVEKLAAIRAYVATTGVPEAALLKMAKLGAVLDDWMAERDVAVSAIQCWTALEEFFGVVPCTLMSMLSDGLTPSGCEVDVCGALSMYALTLAGQTPSALLDWNNNYGEDPERAVCFHCSNLPASFFADAPRMDLQEIIAATVGRENTYGTCVGRIRSGPMTFARLSTDDRHGRIRGYVGEGRFTDDLLDTFGGAGVVCIPGLQALLHRICREGYEHHVASTLGSVASIVHEATTQYLGWDMHWHRG